MAGEFEIVVACSSKWSSSVERVAGDLQAFGGGKIRKFDLRPKQQKRKKNGKNGGIDFSNFTQSQGP